MTPGVNFNAADQVIKFDTATQRYVRHWKPSFLGNDTWWQVGQNFATTNVLLPGEAFFIQNNQTSNQTVYILGEVPDRFTVPTDTSKVSVAGIGGFTFIGYPYPTEIAINDTTLFDTAVPGVNFNDSDQIIRFDPSIQRYVRYWILNGQPHWAKLGEPPINPTTDKFRPGEGFIYQRKPGTVVFDWQEIKPYTWP